MHVRESVCAWLPCCRVHTKWFAFYSKQMSLTSKSCRFAVFLLPSKSFSQRTFSVGPKRFKATAGVDATVAYTVFSTHHHDILLNSIEKSILSLCIIECRVCSWLRSGMTTRLLGVCVCFDLSPFIRHKTYLSSDEKDRERERERGGKCCPRRRIYFSILDQLKNGKSADWSWNEKKSTITYAVHYTPHSSISFYWFIYLFGSEHTHT